MRTRHCMRVLRMIMGAAGCWVAGGLAGANASTLTIGNGVLEVGTGTCIEAGAFILEATATLRGNGTINAPSTLSGRLAPGLPDAVGILTFGTNVSLAGGRYECHAQDHVTLDRIVAWGDVTGTGTVEVAVLTDAIPLWQPIIDGAANSDYRDITVAVPTEWRLDSTGSVSLLLTDLRGDSNTNGLPDWWETQYFGGRTTADPDADSDRDDFRNLQEYQAGTDPLDPESLLKLIGLNRTGNAMDIRWLSVAGKQYRIDGRTNLVAGDWTMLTNAYPASATNTFTRWQHTNMPALYFYRVRLD